MNYLNGLYKQRDIIKDKIIKERNKINKKLEKLQKERFRLNNAISRAKNYEKTKKVI